MRRFDGERFLLAPKERRVVARPRRQPAAVQLDDPRRQRLQEHAVVRDEQRRCPRSRRETLRATASFRCRDDWSARRAAADPAPPTSARASSTRRRQPPDSVRMLASAGICSLESTIRDLLVRLPLVALGSPSASATTSKTRRSSATRASCASRPMRRPGSRQTRPACGARSPLDDLKQRGLTCAVPADDADALARFDPEAGLI